MQVAPDTSAAPALNQRPAANDPDGDIVHPGPLPPGTLGEGAVIRVRLMDRLSTAMNQTGDAFRTRVVSDVIQDGQVLIPAGSEIDGKVAEVSSGHFGGHGSMHLQPETVILADGSRFHLYADISGASVITVHLLMDHPQATLDDGAVLLFTLNEPLHLVAAAQTGN